MQTRYRIALDGIPLDSLSEAICMEDWLESPAQTSTVLHPLARGDGQVCTGSRRTALTVQCRFSIRETHPARRQAIADRVARWAAGSHLLTCSARPGRQLLVRCTRLPVLDSALRWTDCLTLAFTAWERPFWESIRPTRLTLNGTQASGTLHTDGTAPACAEAEVTVTGPAPLTALRLTVGDSELHLTGLRLNTGSTVTIRQMDNGCLAILSGGQSLLPCLTPDSSDRLMATPGGCAVILTADSAVQTVVSARGCWL